MWSRFLRALDGLLWLLRPTGLRKTLALLDERLHRMEARQLETEARVNTLVSPTNVPVPVHGHYLFVDRHDTLGLALHHTHEPYQTSLVNDLVRPGDVVVDAGAHIGYYTLLFARRAGPHGRVIAFEPSPHALALLERNLLANGYAHVEVHRAALHRERGRIPFWTSEAGLAGGAVQNPGGGAPWQQLEVEARALDELLAPGERVDLVKLDIQGGEGFALAGMRRLLTNNRRVKLLLEVWPRGLAACGTPAAEVLAWLEEQGFSLEELREDERRSVPTTARELAERYPETGPLHTNVLARRS